MHVTIAGAGIVGIHCAHALMDAGCTVTLVDADGLAQRTSRGNAGFIAAADILPLAGPKAWRHLPGWLIDPLGPLAIRPSYALRALPWMRRFIAASMPERIEASTRAIIALNGLALPAWERRLVALGLKERHLRHKGFLTVFRNRTDLEAARPTIARQRSLGTAIEILEDGAALRRLEPAFSAAAVAGAHYPDYVIVDDPASITAAVGAAVLERGAVLVRKSVASLRPTERGVQTLLDDGEVLASDMAVVAAGAWSKPLCAALGDRIPLDTERGYNVTLPTGSLGLSRPVAYEGLGFVTTPLDIGDRVGGAVEFAGLEAAPNFKRVDAILRRLRPLLPDAKLEGGTRWMGHRPSLPDSLPVISRSSASERILYAFGHGHYGLTQSAATGEMIAALALQRQTPIDTLPYAAARF